MGRKKSEFSSDDPLRDKPEFMDEQMSTAEEFEGDVMDEITVTRNDSDPKSSEEIDDKSDIQKFLFPIKRGRGRPRLSENIKRERAADRALSGIGKRKRGRPRKQDTLNGPTKPKSPRTAIPRILFSSFVGKEFPRKRRGRPPKKPMSLPPPPNPSIRRNYESRLGPQIDRLASLVDRLENRINFDGLIDEDADIDSEQELEKQIFILQRNFNVKTELKNDFKVIVKCYLEDLAAVSRCLLTSVTSYKDSGKIILYEIWISEIAQLEFAKISSSKIFEKEVTDMFKAETVVKTMTIPARWWQRTS